MTLMRKQLITNDISVCVGCNRCIRVCPVEEANVAYKEDGQIKVKVDPERCIACGACLSACRHDSRDYIDDTGRFFTDLNRGVPISLLAAPAIQSNGNEWKRIFTWLRQLGVRMIYDVSLGADICTWAHIRYIQKNGPQPVITQPCPAIVNFLLMYKPETAKRLSPIHSPILCAATYMKKYEDIKDRIAVISPCIAKTNEFEAAGLADYNITFRKLKEYMDMHNVMLPQEESGFDGMRSSLGRLFPMPGGLKENIEFYIGKELRIDKSEGQNMVYKALEEYGRQSEEYLPAVFDVLNCPEGCNQGTGCIQEKDFFEINTIMDGARKGVTEGEAREYCDILYAEFDQKLNLADFIRDYQSMMVIESFVNDAAIEEAFIKLDKNTHVQRNYDCGACGSATCRDMARKVAKGVNLPSNCIEKTRNDIHREHAALRELQKNNHEDMDLILSDITNVKNLSNNVITNMENVNEAIKIYDNMANLIERISMHIHLISINASVEAARAGEYGKTFGVVAEEIRSLSGQSKTTVEETKQISKQATETTEAINVMIHEIDKAISDSYDNIEEIMKKAGELI